MYLTVHVATGAAIASIIPNPLVSIPLAFGSHFVLDAIPHWHDIKKGDKPTKLTIKISTFDLLISIVLTIFLIGYTNYLYLLYGIIAGSIMDTDAIWYQFSEMKNWRKLWPKSISKLHGEIQNETKSYWGLLTQILIALVSIYIVIYYD